MVPAKLPIHLGMVEGQSIYLCFDLGYSLLYDVLLCLDYGSGFYGICVVGKIYRLKCGDCNFPHPDLRIARRVDVHCEDDGLFCPCAHSCVNSDFFLKSTLQKREDGV